MSMRNIRVASVQFEHTSGDKQANFQKIHHFVNEASKQNVEMIIFPECCITGYWFLRNLSKKELTALAEPVFDGPSSQELAQKTIRELDAKVQQHDPRHKRYILHVSPP